MTWIFDEPAPRERFVTMEKNGESVVKMQPMRIIAAARGTKQGLVLVTNWLPKEERWEFFSKGTEPLAWMPMPEFPAAEIERRAGLAHLKAGIDAATG